MSDADFTIRDQDEVLRVGFGTYMVRKDQMVVQAGRLGTVLLDEDAKKPNLSRRKYTFLANGTVMFFLLFTLSLIFNAGYKLGYFDSVLIAEICRMVLMVATGYILAFNLPINYLWIAYAQNGRKVKFRQMKHVNLAVQSVISQMNSEKESLLTVISYITVGFLCVLILPVVFILNGNYSGALGCFMFPVDAVILVNTISAYAIILSWFIRSSGRKNNRGL